MDFHNRRSHHPDAVTVADVVVYAELLVDGGALYARDDEREAWEPEGEFVDPSGPALYGFSPFFLLEALPAAGEGRSLGEERVRGVRTERIAVEIDVELAQRLSAAGLRVPGRRDSFPAEVWLDAQGRIRRMGCTWPLPRQPAEDVRWVTSEFWDFGVPAPLPSPRR